MVIRDSPGRVEATLSKNLHVPLRPLETEAMTFEDGVSFVRDVGIRDVVFECDSKVVFDTILGYHNPLVAIDNVVVGICASMYYT